MNKPLQPRHAAMLIHGVNKLLESLDKMGELGGVRSRTEHLRAEALRAMLTTLKANGLEMEAPRTIPCVVRGWVDAQAVEGEPDIRFHADLDGVTSEILMKDVPDRFLKATASCDYLEARFDACGLKDLKAAVEQYGSIHQMRAIIPENIQTMLHAAGGEARDNLPSSEPDKDLVRTIVAVEVLHHGYTNVADMRLADIAELITDGDASGVTETLLSERLTRDEMSLALRAQGSDPEFLLGDGDDQTQTSTSRETP